MSVSHIPLRVDWASFLATFPKPGAWTKPCRRKLRLDDNAFSVELMPIYSSVRKRLPPDTVRGLDLLHSAIAIHGVPKTAGFDRSSLYVPSVKYKKADFQSGDCESPIPQCSPEQVALILDAMAAADLDAVKELLEAGWEKLESKVYFFESAKDYVNHLKNWIRLLEEIHSHQGGLAIELI